MPRPNNFPRELRTAREKAGLSVAAAAQQAGVSPRTWAYWEDGERLPPAEADAITRERLIARLTEQATPGNPNTEASRGA
jgi:DNA-binding transcriptional regulator YiaG